LILPVMLFLTLIAVDFGRIFLGYINLQNMARIASNYAANNPTAWLTNDTATITKYRNQILSDAAATNCALTPAVPADPTFIDTNSDGIATGIGDKVSVTFTCRFSVITPIIAKVVGGSVNVTTSAVFPVKSALSATRSGGGCLLPNPAINANPTSGVAPLTVNFADASGGGAGTSWSWAFGDAQTSTLRDPGAHVYTTPGTYTVTLAVNNACGSVTTNPGTTITVTPAATQGLCMVPTLSGVKRNSADALWGTPNPPGAGFTTTVQDGPGAPNGNYTIQSQTIVAGTSVACTSTIAVNG
jgi:PKD repeat protein